MPYRATLSEFLLFCPLAFLWMSWPSVFSLSITSPTSLLVRSLAAFSLPCLAAPTCHSTTSYLRLWILVLPVFWSWTVLPEKSTAHPLQCFGGITQHPRFCDLQSIPSLCRQALRIKERMLPIHHHPGVHQSSLLWGPEPSPFRDLTQLPLVLFSPPS